MPEEPAKTQCFVNVAMTNEKNDSHILPLSHFIFVAMGNIRVNTATCSSINTGRKGPVAPVPEAVLPF